MSAQEPEWPAKLGILGLLRINPDNPDGFTHEESRRNGYNQAIDDCRHAWLASVDDPGVSPVGEVRRGPEGHVFARGLHPDTPWMQVAGGRAGAWDLYRDETVAGWTVIGAVPGTPAAADGGLNAAMFRMPAAEVSE